MLILEYYKRMIKIYKPSFFVYLNLILLLPLSLVVYGKFYIDNLILGIVCNVITVLIIYILYFILMHNLTGNKIKDEVNSLLVYCSFIFLFLNIWNFQILTDNVVFVGGRHFQFVVYSYLIYFISYILFLIAFFLRVFGLNKNNKFNKW